MSETTLDSINVIVVCDPDLRFSLEEQTAKEVLSENLNFSFQSPMHEVRRQLESEHFDLMIMDYALPDGTGFLLYETLKMEGFNLPKAVLVSTEENEKLASEWYRRGGDGYLSRERLETESFKRTLEEVLYRSGDQNSRYEKIYRDSMTGLWNPRYLLRLLEEESVETGTNNPVGCSMIEVRKPRNGWASRGMDFDGNPLVRVSKTIQSVVAHTGIVGRYWGSMFWVLFRNERVKQLSDKLREVIEAVNRVLGKNPGEDSLSYAGAVMTDCSDLEVEQLQRSIDRTLFKAKKSRGSRFMIGRL